MSTKSSQNRNPSQPTTVAVNQRTQDPDMVWSLLKDPPCRSVCPLPLSTPVFDDKVRFVCISDTHNRIDKMRAPPPAGDVLLHAGDFSDAGQLYQVDRFNQFLGSLPHRYKVVIAGNHDLTLDDSMDIHDKTAIMNWVRMPPDSIQQELKARGISHPRDLLTNCIYLQDSETSVFGLRIYGSPWQPWFRSWAFNLRRGQALLDKWNLIPAGVDVLMTHGPPLGHGDVCESGQHVGCVELLTTVQQRVKPKYHVFGHIHEGYGVTTDGTTTFINASTCNINYRPNQDPILFDIDLPPGVSKS